MKKTTIFSGSGVAIITPFDRNGINVVEFEKMIEFQIQNGTDAIIALGTTGEAATMTYDEKIQVVECAKKVIAGRVPLIVGTGSNNTQQAAEFSKVVSEMGVDGILVVTPYYNKATQDGLFKHYEAICNNVTCPVILYNVPSRTGVNIKPQTVKKIYEKIENVVAIKEASGDIAQVTELISICDITVYSGNDDQIVPIMSIGGCGVISVLANVRPKEVHDMTLACLNGNFSTAAKLQLENIKIIKSLFCEVNPIPVKEAMNILGFNAGVPRLPLTKLALENTKILKEAMNECN